MPQGYRTEDGSEDQTQDALSQDNRQRGGQGRGRQGGQEPRTIARGRAQQVAQGGGGPLLPPSARRAGGRRPVSLGGQRPAPRPMGNQSVPQAAPRMPQQPAPIDPSPMAQIPQREPIPNYRPIQQPQTVQQQAMQPPRPQPQEVDAATQQKVEKMAKNNRINIAQVIKDFRGTYKAIGTPQVLIDEVEDYLSEIIEHTKGDAPSINFVQTNLQNAAVIIDKYISETLDKDSRVVQNWLDALFLQRINYKYNDGEINEDFLVKFPEGGNAPQQPDPVKEDAPVHEPIQQAPEAPGVIPDYEPLPEYQAPVNQTVPIQPAKTPVQQSSYHNQQLVPRQTADEFIIEDVPVERTIRKPHRHVGTKPVQKAPQKRKKPEITIIPQDNELKALFVQAKKQAYSNNPAKAMNIFQKALIRAEAINDSEAQSKICFEMGKIYDDNNYLVQALSNYNKSLKDTTDTTIKTKAHYSMAKIYDDVNQVHSAIDHYMTSVSYAGAEDDLSSQSKSLTNIANIYTDRYDQDAFIFYDEAHILIEQTDDSEMKGYVSSNTAGALNKFNKPDKALKCYANAVKNYTEAKVENSIAENYYSAGELMYDLKNPAKAKILLKKALSHAVPMKDAELINKINDLLEEIG